MLAYIFPLRGFFVAYFTLIGLSLLSHGLHKDKSQFSNTLSEVLRIRFSVVFINFFNVGDLTGMPNSKYVSDSLFESVFRIGSDAHLNLIREARKMYSRDIINLCEEDEHIIKTHLGELWTHISGDRRA